MRRYQVNFLCGTDIRASCTIEANSEVSALVLAMLKVTTMGWVTEYHFKILIELA